MKKVFLDIETTGLPPKGGKWDTDFDQYPYVVQLAFITEIEGQQPVMSDFIVRPDGYVIPEEMTAIHGITTQFAATHGIPYEIAMMKLSEALQGADLIIGHNIHFDTSIIKANILKLGLDVAPMDALLDKEKRVDTMMKSVSYCAIPHPSGRGVKWPKLQELHNKLFGCDFENAHNAAGDIEATRKCYYKMVELNLL